MPDQRNDLENLYREMPLKYRLFAKLLQRFPNPELPFFVLRRLPLLEGIFYAVMLPIFVFLSGALTLWLFTTVTGAFGFPLNIVVGLLLPAAVLLIFVRIQLGRMINWWRSVIGSPIAWDSSKSITELVELFKKQQNRAKNK